MRRRQQTEALKNVFIASPFASETQEQHDKHIAYAEDALRDSFKRNEAPFAPHLLYTRVLNDKDPKQRQQALKAADAFLVWCDVLAVYEDLGISPGMQKEIERAAKLQGMNIEFRSLPKWKPEKEDSKESLLPEDTGFSKNVIEGIREIKRDELYYGRGNWRY